jgi:23S rRNA pseudouridine2605 synthase
MKNTRKPGEGGRKPFKRNGRPGEKAGKPAFKKSSGKPRPAAERNPAHVAVTGEGERISKIMARAGVASRRDCERMILEGRVTLNGTVLTTPAVNCLPSDTIEVDGKPIKAIERTRLWIYYKPAGLVTTNHDPEGRPTVFDNLPAELPRVISVGRLDINTEGLLLLTNDGGLARMLELPTTGWLRRYRVRAHGAIDQARLDALKEGIAVDGIFYGAIEATLDREQGHNVWITMGLREGKNREIKNVLGELGLDVNRLIRISYGPFQLGELEEGQVVEVKSRTLRDQLGPRLIADANANFEAPIHQAPHEKDEEEGETKRAWGAERPKRESREERRERDLARIDTKRPERGDRPDRGDRGDRPRGRDRDGERRGGRERDDDRKPKRPPLGTSRTANVWMAPGARPVAAKKAKEETDEAKPTRRILRLKKEGGETVSAPARELKPKRADRPARPERPKKSERPERSERPAGKSFAGKRGETGAEGERARPARAFSGKRSEDGGPERKPRGGKPFGDRNRDSEAKPARSFAGKPDRKNAGDEPRKRAPRQDRPRTDGPQGDGPRRGGPAGKGMRSGADRRR